MTLTLHELHIPLVLSILKVIILWHTEMTLTCMITLDMKVMALDSIYIPVVLI